MKHAAFWAGVASVWAVMLLGVGKARADTDMSAGYALGSGLLGADMFVDQALAGGGDFRYQQDNLPGVGAGEAADADFVIEFDGLWSPGEEVTLTGLAHVLHDQQTGVTGVNGPQTFTYTFYQLGPDEDFTGKTNEVVIGSVSVTHTSPDDAGADEYWFNFEPGEVIAFRSTGSGVAIEIDSDGPMRFKAQNAPFGAADPNFLPAGPALGQWKNENTGISAGTDRRFRMSLAGTAEAVGPPFVLTDLTDSVVTVLGADVALSPHVVGEAPLSFQWTLNGTDLPGETNSTLSVTNAGIAAAGPYALRAANALGTTNTSNATLTYVGPALVPESQVVFALNPFGIVPQLPDGPGRSYQWRKDGVDVSGQTDLDFSRAAASVADAGTYELVYSLGGHTVTSETAQVIVPPPPTEAYAALVARDLPRAYWRLGESAGATVAEEEIALLVASGLDGTYGTEAVPGEVGALLGDANTALRCLGNTNSVVEVASDLDTPSVDAPFSVEIWAMVEGGQGTTRAPLAYVDWVNSTYISGWILYANADDRWEFRTGEGEVNAPDASAWNVIVGPPVGLGQWTHLVGVHDGSDLKLYVNGVLAGTLADAAFSPIDNFGTGTPIVIGGGSALDGQIGTTGDYWIGKVDEPALYGTALTATQVLEHYAAAFPLSTPPVIDTHPQDIAVLEGLEADFLVAANSVTPLSYQWLYNGGELNGETNDRLRVTGVLASNAGDYQVVVGNNGGSVTSEVARLSVYADVADTVLSVNLLGYVNGDAWVGESIAANGGVAGFIATNAWNEIGADTGNQATPVGDLVDDRGAVTGITLTWGSTQTRRGRLNELGGPVDADQAMLQSGIESRLSATSTTAVVTLTISNVPPQYIATGYDVIVYLGGPAGGVTNRYDTVDPSFYGEVTDGSRAFYFHVRDQRTWDGAFVEATETDANAPTPPDANMVIFTGLTAPVVTVTGDAHPVIGQGPVQVSGLQIVPGRTPPDASMIIGAPGGVITVDWTGGGVLQSAPGLPADTWSDVDGGTVTNGPYVVPTPQPTESFRLRTP